MDPPKGFSQPPSPCYNFHLDCQRSSAVSMTYWTTRNLGLYEIPPVPSPAAHSKLLPGCPWVHKMLLCLTFPRFLYSVTQWSVPSLDSGVSWIILCNQSLFSPMLCRVPSHPFVHQKLVSNKITVSPFKSKDLWSSGTKYSTLQVSTPVLQPLDRAHPEKILSLSSVFFSQTSPIE